MDIFTQITEYGLTAYIIVLVVVFFMLFFWLMMLIDCIKRQYGKKYLWLVLLIIFNIPASWVYYFLVKRPALGMESKEASRHVEEHNKPVREKLEESGALKPKEEEKPEPKQEEAEQPESQETEEPRGRTLEDLKEQAEETKTKPEIVR